MAEALHPESSEEFWNNSALERLLKDKYNKADYINLTYDGKRLKWVASYELLKKFVEETIALKGKWISPGGHARKFVCSGIDLSLTWYFGKYNSLILHGELSSDLSDALIKVCQQTATFKTNTRCDDKLTTSPLAGELSPTAPNTNDDSYYLSAISMDNEATIKPEVLFMGDTTLDEHCHKVRSKHVYQKSSDISQCDCKCGLLAAELEGIKLDMVIMQRNIESKISTSNTIRESDEIKCLKQELANAKERCKHLEGEIQILIKGRNNEVEDLNQTIVSLENKLKASEALNASLSGEIASINSLDKPKQRENSRKVHSTKDKVIKSGEKQSERCKCQNEQNNNCEKPCNPANPQLIRQHHNRKQTILSNANKVPKGHKKTKRVNKSRPSYPPKWLAQLPLLTAPNLERYSKAKPLTRSIFVPNDINNYTVVDDDSEISNKESSRVNKVERKYKSSSSNKDTKSRHTYRTQEVGNTCPTKVPKSCGSQVHDKNQTPNILRKKNEISLNSEESQVTDQVNEVTKQLFINTSSDLTRQQLQNNFANATDNNSDHSSHNIPVRVTHRPQNEYLSHRSTRRRKSFFRRRTKKHRPPDWPEFLELVKQITTTA